jgi:hypothetical protein
VASRLICAQAEILLPQVTLPLSLSQFHVSDCDAPLEFVAVKYAL